ncbi:MAG: heparinase II/III family protein [Clostridia bacterium]|nr:heparinase II/III family protein [Clostridia bacterium]
MYQRFIGNLPKNSHTEKLLVPIRIAAEEFKKDVGSKGLTFDLYKIFFETGSRLEYEAEYILHRKRLNAFMVMCLAGEDYIGELENAIWTICDEFTWALPAHLGGLPVAEHFRRIDLFAAETALMLSETLSLLEDKLNPMVAERMRFELLRRVIEPYKAGTAHISLHANWAAVTMAGIAAAVLYICEKEEATALIPQMVLHMQKFLDSFQEDGCCLEGPLYWEYGFSHFCMFADYLFHYTKGEINLMQDEKVHNIALYRQKVTLEPDKVIPFADSCHIYKYHVGLSHFLAKQYDDVLPIFEENEVTFEEDLRQRFGSMIRDFYWYDEHIYGKNLPNGKYGFTDSMQTVFRKDKFVLAVKGGHNDEPHNHNDLGSFVLFADGQFILDDPGWSEYEDGYFGANRYHHICTSSLGHSVPIINGKTQIPGKDAKTILLENTETHVKLDVSAAYGEIFIRDFSVTEEGVTITDTFDETAEVTERLITRIKPEVKGDTVTIGNWTITASGAEFSGITEQVFHPRKNIVAWDTADSDLMYQIDFKVVNSEKVIFSIK